MALTNRLLIDGVDAYTEYGLALKSYAPLFVWPTYKPVETNDWHESDALEADLSNPVLNGRQFSLVFYLTHHEDIMRAQSLLSVLAQQTYHTLNFQALGYSIANARYVSNSAFDTNENFDTLTITFAEDSVPKPNTAIPEEFTAPQLGYLMDDADFGIFGCTVTKGTRASMWRYAGAKENQKSESQFSGGIVYDSTDGVHLTSRDITVNLHMHSTLSDFWTNWNALWTAVFKIESARGSSAALRVLEGDGMEFQCYYKKNSVSRFILTDEGEVWCDFSIVFSVLAYSRGDDWYYLASEASEQVTTEDQDVENDPLYVRIGVPSNLLATLAVNAEAHTAVKISQLPSAGSTFGAARGLVTIGVNNVNQSVQIPIGDILNALVDRVSLTYNIDNEHPLADGEYYTLQQAVEVVAADSSVSDKSKSGMVVVFFDGEEWRLWQFQQRYDREAPENFVNTDNWMELAVSTNLAAKADKTYVDEIRDNLMAAISAASATGGIIRLTQTQYGLLQEKDPTTIYAVTNASDTLRKIYLGTTLIAKADTSGNNGFTYTFPIIFQN